MVGLGLLFFVGSLAVCAAVALAGGVSNLFEHCPTKPAPPTVAVEYVCLSVGMC